MESNRRKQAKIDIGLDDSKELKDIAKATQVEIKRQKEKADEKLRIEQSRSYQMLKGIAKTMDRYFLDPIIGFIPGGIGDAISSVVSMPFLYVSLFKVKSIPLTLAVLFNIMTDVFIGLIPFWIGNILDVFNRSYLRNMKLIVGFVEDDKEIIKKVNKQAVYSFLGILLFSVLIYYMIKLAAMIINWFLGLFS
ncbi:DUF4112 domain-containing protein [Myroides pelagicus]|uniref:DUF4112 domain-containing protein n=1 Tax=Myroides pelagicus TaxID=270914 RepID=A0A7K1GMB8_9FLAO|nr:DUF4112 domain-containing protein [Myroides pelagicus]MTH29961.1 DUF4112 domain-containing protein [Myroides pelagicus]